MGWLTAGYRRLIKGQPVDSRYIRVFITDSAYPILNGLVHKTPASIEETDGYPLGLTYSDRLLTANGQWNGGEGVRGTSM